MIKYCDITSSYHTGSLGHAKEFLVESLKQLFFHLNHAVIMKVDERPFCERQRPEGGMYPS